MITNMRTYLRCGLYYCVLCAGFVALLAQTPAGANSDVRVSHDIVVEGGSECIVSYCISIAWPDTGKRMKVLPPTVPLPDGLTQESLATETVRAVSDAGDQKIAKYTYRLKPVGGGTYTLRDVTVKYYYGLGEEPLTRTLQPISCTVKKKLFCLHDIRFNTHTVLGGIMFIGICVMGVNLFRMITHSAQNSISRSDAFRQKFNQLSATFERGEYSQVVLDLDQLIRAHLKNQSGITLENTITADEMRAIPELASFDQAGLQVLYRVFSRAHAVRYGNATVARHDVRLLIDDVKRVLSEED